MKRTSILPLALLALVLAACSSGQASSTAQPSPSATEEPTPEPTESPSPSEAESSGSAVAIPSLDLNGDPELAGRFPDTIDGQPLQMQSFRGDTFMEGNPDPSFEEFLASVGAEPEDVSVAFGGVVSGETFITVGAFRVLGVPEDQLEAEFLGASEEAGDLSNLSETSVGGKDVWTAMAPDAGSGEAAVGTAYIYTKDDTIYYITGTEEQAAEILAALP